MPGFFVEVEKPVLTGIGIEPGPEPSLAPFRDGVALGVIVDIAALGPVLPEVDRDPRLMIAVPGSCNLSRK